MAIHYRLPLRRPFCHRGTARPRGAGNGIHLHRALLFDHLGGILGGGGGGGGSGASIS